jgi:peptidoglycan/LPS O-acetylase OafA/YrhL
VKQRLDHIDALRGLAALYVVLHHVSKALAMPGTPLERLTQPFAYGRAGVDLFLVVSGFVLFLPIVQGWRPMEAYGRFMARRAWRIVPPYYVAFALSYLIYWGVPGIAKRMYGHGDDISLGNVLAHALMVNNLGPPQWQYGVNYVLWTIPLEFQLYATFPLLAWVLARLGPVRAAGAALFLTVVARYLVAHLGLPQGLAASVPGFLGVFVAGMAAAAIATRHPNLAATPRRLLGLAALGALAAAVVAWPTAGSFLVSDAFFGLGFAALVLWLGGRPRAIPAPAAWLGRISYSLYLLHAPLLAIWTMDFVTRGDGSILTYLRTLAVAVPAMIVISWVFHRFVERPFLGRTPFLAPQAPQDQRPAA